MSAKSPSRGSPNGSGDNGTASRRSHGISRPYRRGRVSPKQNARSRRHPDRVGFVARRPKCRRPRRKVRRPILAVAFANPRAPTETPAGPSPRHESSCGWSSLQLCSRPSSEDRHKLARWPIKAATLDCTDVTTVARRNRPFGRAVVLRTNTPRRSPAASLRASNNPLARPATTSRRSARLARRVLQPARRGSSIGEGTHERAVRMEDTS